MQLKRYEGKTLRGTLERVKQELGPDALIVSSRTFRKDHGLFGLLNGRKVEVVAALDRHMEGPKTLKEAIRHSRPLVPDNGPARELEKVVPVENHTNPRNEPLEDLLKELDIRSELRACYRQMVRYGVQHHIAFRLVRSAQTQKGGESPAAGLTEAIGKHIRFADYESGTTRVVVLIGPTGVGKTTTLAKLAARDRFERQESVAFVTMDNYRIAAVEQLRVYANILGVPLSVAHSPDELPSLLENLVERFERIYVDTAGRGLREASHISDLGNVFGKCRDIHPMLLIGANTNEVDARYILKRYSALGPRSLVLSKVDECVCFGPVLNYLSGNDIPLAYVSNGQNVPDDLEPATPKSILKYLFSTGKTV